MVDAVGLSVTDHGVQDVHGNFHWFIRDTATGASIAALDDIRPPAGATPYDVIGLSDDGASALVAFRDEALGPAQIYLWSIADGALHQVVTDYPEGGAIPVLSGDGRSVAYQIGRTIHVWQREKGAAVRVPVPSTRYGYCQSNGMVDLSNDGTRLAVDIGYTTVDDCTLLKSYGETITVPVPN